MPDLEDGQTARVQDSARVAITAAEPVARLRTWASGRCLSASQPGIYTSPKGTVVKPAR